MEILQNILILVGIIFLCINIARFGVSAIAIVFGYGEKKYNPIARVWNTIETTAIIWTLVILIINYYS